MSLNLPRSQTMGYNNGIEFTKMPATFVFHAPDNKQIFVTARFASSPSIFRGGSASRRRKLLTNLEATKASAEVPHSVDRRLVRMHNRLLL